MLLAIYIRIDGEQRSENGIREKLLACYHECRPLIGYTTHYLLRALATKMAAAYWRFRSVCEENLDLKNLNDW